MSEVKRKKLVKSLSASIKNAGLRIEKPCRWSIPNSTVAQATLWTYGFPAQAPTVWFAMTGFPEVGKTRDAFLVALSREEPISTAFEFNIGVRPSNRMNVRLQDGGSGHVIVRCMCSFAFKGAVRQPAALFYDFVRDEKIPLTLEQHGNKTFVRLLELSLENVESDWLRIWQHLADFGAVVHRFKTSSMV